MYFNTLFFTSLSIFLIIRFSVQAQKIHDERNGPSIQAEHWRMNEKQVVDFNCYNYANSAQKMTDAGVANSFKAFRYYQGEAEKKRDKLLKEVASA